MNLKLVKKIIEAKNTKSFFFEKPKGLEFVAGQYSYLTLGKTTKQFTIASSPTEEFVQITTRIRRESEFKQNLDSLEIGSEIESRAPFGSFCYNYSLNPVRYTLFLAGGIGITPFRSFIKYNIDRKLGIKMHLIYSNSDSEFVFKEELDQWQKENDFIKVSYHNSSISGHLDSEVLSELIPKPYSLYSSFFVVGPNAFVNSMEDILEELSVPSDKISTEKFTGY
jgi:ferredoxin-NADP reductase